jgi:type II restriction enzyme
MSPPRSDDAAARGAWKSDFERVREQTAAARPVWQLEREGDTTHAEVQGWLRDLGLAFSGLDPSQRPWSPPWRRATRGRLSRRVAACLHAAGETVRLIDALWIERETQSVAAAFEVEHSTSVYSWGRADARPCARSTDERWLRVVSRVRAPVTKH